MMIVIIYKIFNLAECNMQLIKPKDGTFLGNVIDIENTEFKGCTLLT